MLPHFGCRHSTRQRARHHRIRRSDRGRIHGARIINNIIDGLIGNRYRVSDREAIRRCGGAAVDKAEREYRRFSTGLPKAYPGYGGFVRVVAITDVQRRNLGVRVRGILDIARHGYRGGRRGDVNFRCGTDRRGRRKADVSYSAYER